MNINTSNITNTQRNLLFFFACIPVRIAYAIFQNSKYSILWLNLIMGAGFIRKWWVWDGKEKGAFGGTLWWNNMRLIHGIIYILSFFNPQLLYLDVVIGLFAKIHNIYSS
jgi:hypothetical protein